MLLDVPCKTGKLQVTEDGTLRVQQMFNQILWQVPCSSVTRITSKDGFALSSDITFHTEQGRYQADMVSKLKTAKVYALFPGIEQGGSQAQGPSYKTGNQQPPTLKGALGTVLFPEIAIASKIAGIGCNKWYQD